MNNLKNKLSMTLSIILLLAFSCGKKNDPKPKEEVKPDTEVPKVSLSSDVSYVIQPGKIKIKATVTDNVGVQRVEFYMGNALISTDVEAPFELERDYNSTAYGDEKYTAAAYDAAGNKAVSTELRIRVNVERTTPVLTIMLSKTRYSKTDLVAPLAILVGAPNKSGTIAYALLKGEGCPGVGAGVGDYFHILNFRDEEEYMPSINFNNREVGKKSIKAMVTIAGRPAIYSNCVSYEIWNY